MLCLLILPLMLLAGDSPSPEGAQAYFVDLKDGDTISSPVLIRLGLTEQMGIAPALADWPDTGHFHIILDDESPKPNKAVPKQHIHLNFGQTEKTVNLTKGQHTLQLVLGDYSHIPHDPPVMSERITITVE